MNTQQEIKPDITALPPRPESSFPLNDGQYAVFTTLMQQITSARDGRLPECVYAHVAGGTGTGKTRLLQRLLEASREAGASCQAAAYTTKAAFKLDGCYGQTAQKLFGLGIESNSSARGTFCTSTLPTLDALLIDDAQVLSAGQLDAMHAAMVVYGFRGVLVIAADGAQLGPIVRGEHMHARVSLHSASCWHLFKQRYELRRQERITDERLASAVADISRGRWVSGALGLGAGNSYTALHSHTRTVHLPCTVFPTRGRLLSADGYTAAARAWACGTSVHPSAATAAEVLPGCIVCTNNNRVDEHNAEILATWPGVARAFRAAPPPRFRMPRTPQVFAFDANRGNYTDELVLKLHAPVRITANVDLERGLVTDALALIVGWQSDSVDIRLVDPVDPAAGSAGAATHRLSRSLWRVKEGGVGGDWRNSRSEEKLQFPLRLTWAVTAHRVHAFEPERVVVDLRDSCWAHGQLGVMLSRASRRSNMRVLVHYSDNGHFSTPNCVIRDIVDGFEGAR